MQIPDPAEVLEGIGRRDHSVTREYRIFGPPGTGKTTHAARQIRIAVNRFDANSVLAISFSRATAAELTDGTFLLTRAILEHCTRSVITPWDARRSRRSTPTSGTA